MASPSSAAAPPPPPASNLLTHNPCTLRQRLMTQHSRTRYLSRIPYASLEIIICVALANIVVWIVVAVVLHFYPHLTSSAVLAYTLGLRHALDADHISAIDLTTRRLLVLGRRVDDDGVGDGNCHGRGKVKKVKPVVSVGMWFSLGHSTIVIITTILVAATTAAVSAHFDAFASIGGVIGSSVSTTFLLLLGAINGWLLWKAITNLRRLVREYRAGTARDRNLDLEKSTIPDTEIKVFYKSNTHDIKDDQGEIQPVGLSPSQAGNPNLVPPVHATKDTKPIANHTEEEALTLRNRSCLTTLLRWCLRLIDRPWKIYPLGILFGLGFDTSSEIALLGITTLESSRANSATTSSMEGDTTATIGALPASAIWAILIFPLLFTSGMCLLDTTDGALMYALYTARTRSATTAEPATFGDDSNDSNNDTPRGNPEANSELAIAYSNVILTGFTVLVALAVGMLQMFNMLSNVLPQGMLDGSRAFWDGVDVVGDRYDVVGGVVCGGFVLVAGLAWAGYGVWRKRVVEEH